MARATRTAESRIANPRPDARGTALRIGLLLSPFFLNDILYWSAAGQNEPLRTWIDLLTSFWGASLLYFSFRLDWWNLADLRDPRRQTIPMEIFVGVAFGAGIILASVPIRLLIWLGGRFSGFDLPFPGAWSGMESEPVGAALRIVLVSVAGAFVEETAFRGALLQMLRLIGLEGFRLTFLAAGIYAAVHWSGGPLLWITAFSFGCLWTFLFQRIGLAGTITAHAIFDIVTAFGAQQAVVGWWIAE